jgi:cytochrome c2
MLRPGQLVWFAYCVVAMLILNGCNRGTVAAAEVRVPGGDVQRGRILLQEYGCHSCHTIPGVPNADSYVGPPLTAWADRHYIAGSLPNEPDNLLLWIRFPQAVEPGTAMPNLGVDEQDALDMAAYLYTLRAN